MSLKVSYNNILKSISKINYFVDFDYFTIHQLYTFGIIENQINKFTFNFK